MYSDGTTIGPPSCCTSRARRPSYTSGGKATSDWAAPGAGSAAIAASAASAANASGVGGTSVRAIGS
jgi:hypothetical protein